MLTVWVPVVSLLLSPGLAFSLLASYTDSMCGVTFTERCPHVSKAALNTV